MQNLITQFADEANLVEPGRVYGASEPVLATIITTVTTATTSATSITSLFGYHDAKRVDVMADMDADASVDEMLAARADVMSA
ncbi:hypothetical protein [Microbacterium marinilacus]|uniref:Uncharacterized protein n=1 Tax=Microbacterium marinilacus TaxID=415209 RepID=A0ABP7BLF0_9MICO|nr:hypothetical protein [Microbacterium marinilacus]MBY0688815.1 hypothetical protein [Microbacterium marinilacus]